MSGAGTRGGPVRLALLRLALVQAALGAIVVLATSTLNRVMVVELALPAALPAALVALHYLVQSIRPRVGFGADRAGRCTPWILGGMAVLALGATGAAAAVALMGAHPAAGLALAVAAYAAVGLGVGAAGTGNLALVAKHVGPERRADAATGIWITMIAGFALSAGLAGHFLQPYAPARLVAVVACAAACAAVLAVLALGGLERRLDAAAPAAPAQPAVAGGRFGAALRGVLAEPRARAFTLFLFASMLAFSAEELLVESFAGLAFGYSPGRGAQLAGLEHGGVLCGMAGLWAFSRRAGRGGLRNWMVGGTLASALGLLLLAAVGHWHVQPALAPVVFGLGVANGGFAVAALGLMIELAAAAGRQQVGLRMGVWGAAQALAFALGGLGSGAALDLARRAWGLPGDAYGAVFALAALVFAAAAWRARALPGATRAPAGAPLATAGAAQREATWDALVIGGGPAGATAAHELARRGLRVALLERGGRIKPCGGAVPPRLIDDFGIPESLLSARVDAARMVAPSGRQVDMAIESGTVGMVDRAVFDEWLRERARHAGAERIAGSFESLQRLEGGGYYVAWQDGGGQSHGARVRTVVGADGANSQVARQGIAGAGRVRHCAAYHEVLETPPGFDGRRCEVHYDARYSPDFYGWVFPHGATLSVGVGSAQRGYSLRGATARLRTATGLEAARVVRREGAPLPMKPLRRWDDGHGLVLAGDAAGVVAPASGEGIYYAMLGGRLAAGAVAACLATGDARSLAQARSAFMREHGRVFRILGILQWFWYGSDARRERFVSLCRDPGIQRLTWQSYLHKRLARSPLRERMRIFAKDLAHLLGLVKAWTAGR